MSWTPVFDKQEGGGVAVSLVVDGDKLHVRHEQDVEPLLDRNMREFNDPTPADKETGLRKVASLDMVTMMELMKRGIVSKGGTIIDQKAMRKFLNDGDNRKLRTRPEWL